MQLIYKMIYESSPIQSAAKKITNNEIVFVILKI